MRDQLNKIRDELQAAAKLPMMLAATRVFPIVWMLWGLLESIVSQLEKERRE